MEALMRSYKVADVHLRIETGEPLPPEALFVGVARAVGWSVPEVKALDQDDGLMLLDWLRVESAARARDDLARRAPK